MKIQNARAKVSLSLLAVLAALIPLVGDSESSLRPASSVTVYDSNHRTVGLMVDATFLLDQIAGFSGPRLTQSIPTVLFRSGQQIVPLGVQVSGFLGTSPTLNFATPDCTGTAYFFPPNQPQGPSPLSRSFVADDGTLYVSPGNSTPLVVHIETAFIPGFSGCQNNSVGNQQVTEASPVANLNDLYTPPFSVR